MDESLNYPQSEKMNLKLIQSLLERAQMRRRCWKLKSVQELEDLPEKLLGTNTRLKEVIHGPTLFSNAAWTLSL